MNNFNSNNDNSKDLTQNSPKHNLSKYEYDLFDDKKYVVHQLLQVRRTEMPNKEIKWKVLVDQKIIAIIESSKLTKTEVLYLNTNEGFSFLLSFYRAHSSGTEIKNFTEALKEQLKKK